MNTLGELAITIQNLSDRYGEDTPVRIASTGYRPYTQHDIVDIVDVVVPDDSPEGGERYVYLVEEEGNHLLHPIARDAVRGNL